jgi:hypothetical protein
MEDGRVGPTGVDVVSLVTLAFVIDEGHVVILHQPLEAKSVLALM